MEATALKEEQIIEFATKADLLQIKTELVGKIDKLETRLDGKIDTAVARLEGKIDTEVQKSKADILKWMFIFWASQIGAVFALLKFFT